MKLRDIKMIACLMIKIKQLFDNIEIVSHIFARQIICLRICAMNYDANFFFSVKQIERQNVEKLPFSERQCWKKKR